ncbi:MAG: hypothetical protein ACJA2X_001239 [Halocynthiibacter sp.]
MIIDRFSAQPDYPFPRYFNDVAQYSAVQQYWLAVLRSVPQFDETQWAPTEKPVDLSDDMYLGLVVDIERVDIRKSIRIYAASLEGRANFILNEDMETTKAMASHPMPHDVAAAQKEMTDSGLIRTQVETLERAMAEAQGEFITSGGFEAGVGTRGYFIETPSDPMGGNIVDGEELSIISTIDPENETKARHAIDLFITEGSAMKRVNDIFATK